MALQPSLPPTPPPPMGTPQRGGPPRTPPQPPGAVPPPGAPKAPGAPGAPGEEDQQELGPSLSFMQQPWVQNILPFVTSLTVHAGIIVLGFVAIGLYTHTVAPLLEKEQTIIPEATLADAGPPGGVPNNGPNNDPFKQMMQDTTPDGGKPDGVANKASPTLDLQAAGGGSGDGDASPSIGLGVGGLGGGKGVGGGKGDGSGGGTGDGGGPLAMFGAPGGGAIGPHGPVFGNGGNARKIVFICDSTGSMLNKMASLKNELQKAVGGLKPIQSFDIIFFHDEKCLALNINELESATADSKRKAYRFLDDITASGTTDPLPAIEAGFKLQPQLIYILSDAADFPDNKAFEDLCRKLNPGHKIKVNTILFYENTTEAEQNKDSEDLMVRVAKDSGGVFKHVVMTDLENN